MMSDDEVHTSRVSPDVETLIWIVIGVDAKVDDDKMYNPHPWTNRRINLLHFGLHLIQIK
jgi:hypothetical protein